MKLFNIIILISLFIYSGCIRNNEKIQVVTFRNSFDFIVQKGKPNFKEVYDIKVVKKDDLTLYFVAYPREGAEMLLQTDGTYKDGEILYDTIRTYYILEKGKREGLQYDSLSIVLGKKFDADSILKSFNMDEKSLADNAIDHGKLVFSSYDKKTGKLLVEKYFSQEADDFDSVL